MSSERQTDPQSPSLSLWILTRPKNGGTRFVRVEACIEQSRFNSPSSLPASSFYPLANSPLARASHTARSKVKGSPLGPPCGHGNSVDSELHSREYRLGTGNPAYHTFPSMQRGHCCPMLSFRPRSLPPSLPPFLFKQKANHHDKR